jgi:hypothetical protein
MYDTREKAIRDQQWVLNSACAHAREEGREEGEIRGEIRGQIKGETTGEINMIQTLQEIIGMPVSNQTDLRSQSLEQLRLITAELRARILNRPSVPPGSASGHVGA